MEAATCSLITKEHIWEHFEEVIVPGKSLFGTNCIATNLGNSGYCTDLHAQAHWVFSSVCKNGAVRILSDFPMVQVADTAGILLGLAGVRPRGYEQLFSCISTKPLQPGS